jgi:hypothetical protein
MAIPSFPLFFLAWIRQAQMLRSSSVDGLNIAGNMPDLAMLFRAGSQMAG